MSSTPTYPSWSESRASLYLELVLVLVVLVLGLPLGLLLLLFPLMGTLITDKWSFLLAAAIPLGLFVKLLIPMLRIRFCRTMELQEAHLFLGKRWPIEIPYQQVEVIRHGVDVVQGMATPSEQWVEIVAGKFKRKYALGTQSEACVEALRARCSNAQFIPLGEAHARQLAEYANPLQRFLE